MSKPNPLTHSPRYNSFIASRDKALERILNKYKASINLAYHNAITLVYQTYFANYPHDVSRFGRRKGLSARLSQQVDQIFAPLAYEISHLTHRMRASVYTLSRAGESEAIGRAIGRPLKVSLDHPKISEQVAKKMAAGGTPHDRADHALLKLKHKIIEAFEKAFLLEESPSDALKRLEKTLPKATQTKRAKVLRQQKPLKERGVKPVDPEKQNTEFFTVGIIDEPTWEQTKDDYFSDYLPSEIYRRGPDDKQIQYTVNDDGTVDFVPRYEWELEQEITHDFVEQVRQGQVDAANENGIDDFQWVAIVDNKTDDCCIHRDGLSSAEIETQLENGDLDSNTCDAVVPPGHFKCRCRPIPKSSELPDTPTPDFGSFEDWLNEKAAA